MAGIQTPEEAAKVKELEATLDFLKEKRPADTERKEEDNKATDTKAEEKKEPVQGRAQDDPETDENKDKASAPLENHTVVSSMSALDRARASRFAPPKHVLEQVSEKKDTAPQEQLPEKKETASQEQIPEKKDTPEFRPAMTVEEAKKQGIIAPGTYGKPEEPKVPKAPKPAQPIRNPLPIPKKHEAKDMDFDHEIASLDMHFDVVDMSGIDFFDIN